MNYVGIDIHKRYSVLVAQDERGWKLREARIEGNAASGFVQFFQSLEGPSQAVLEACWNWRLTHDLLEEIDEVEEVVLAHPLKTRLIADAQIKTDRLDALGLGTLLRGNLVARAHIPGRETRARKNLLRQRLFLAHPPASLFPSASSLGASAHDAAQSHPRAARPAARPGTARLLGHLRREGAGLSTQAPTA